VLVSVPVGYKNSIRQPCSSGQWLSTERHDSIAAMLASLLYVVLRRLLTIVEPTHRSDDVAQIETTRTIWPSETPRAFGH
jgi:hypothetical protein